MGRSSAKIHIGRLSGNAPISVDGLSPQFAATRLLSPAKQIKAAEWSSKLVDASVPPSETIFCHRDGSPITSFKKSFEQALRKAGVLYGSDGKKRTPYSLRHTYATMRLSGGSAFWRWCVPGWPVLSQLGSSSVALHRRNRMVDQAIHEYAAALSTADYASRSRRLIECAKDSGHCPGLREAS
jgi:integrase